MLPRIFKIIMTGFAFWSYSSSHLGIVLHFRISWIHLLINCWVKHIVKSVLQVIECFSFSSFVFSFFIIQWQLAQNFLNTQLTLLFSGCDITLFKFGRISEETIWLYESWDRHKEMYISSRKVWWWAMSGLQQQLPRPVWTQGQGLWCFMCRHS